MKKSLFMVVSLFMVSGWFALAAPGAACQAAISGNATVSGSWFSTCASVNHRGSYAQYYTFTLAETAIVQIDLESSVDPYLYLLAGDRPVDRFITSNDNGAGNFNSRIVRQLTAGTYTIEATTRNTGFTGSFRLSVWTNGGPGSCRSVIGANADADGSWTADCTSIHRTGSYARYYTFTVPATTSVQIDLVSNADSYLYLLSGDSPANGFITSNDNGGGNFNARIVRTLVPGTYTIEATTDDPAVTGSFRVSVRSAGGGETCRVAVPPNVTRNDSWTSACTSVHRTGSYARYYTFTLAQPVSVQIDAVSGSDSYLYLLAGDNPSNNVITSNDNGGGNFNARIVRTLAAGTYTIEATTDDPGVSGPFTLSLRSNGGAPTCRTVLGLGATARGNWTPACTSVHRPGSNARYYTFTLKKSTNVQIDLSSAANSYLYLLSGASPSNSVITSNDNGGGNFNARIVRTLAAGAYTVEATTNLAGAQGAFTLKLTKLGKGELIDLEEAVEVEP